jgi:tetratricopeptide (TPR) repeat protein
MAVKTGMLAKSSGRSVQRGLCVTGLHWIAILGAVVTLVGLPGCAGWKGGRTPVPDVKPLREDRAKEAIAEFEKERNAAQYQAALSSWKQGNVTGCREALEKLLTREPDRRDARMLLAEVHLINEEFDQAQAIVQKLIDQDPKDAHAQHTLGLLLEVQGKQREAVACYERAVQLAPEDMAIATSYEAAVESLDNEGAIPPTSGRTKTQGPALASDAHPAANPQYTDSNRKSDSKLAAGSTGLNSVHLTNECRACLKQGDEALDQVDLDMFVNCTRSAMQAQPRDPKVPNLAAVSALRHNQAELAVQIANEGIHTAGESAELYRTLGAAQYRLGQHPEAQVSLGKSLSLDKSNALAYFLMGCTLNKLGEHEKADEHLQKARQIDPRYQARQ